MAETFPCSHPVDEGRGGGGGEEGGKGWEPVCEILVDIRGIIILGEFGEEGGERETDKKKRRFLNPPLPSSFSSALLCSVCVFAGSEMRRCREHGLQVAGQHSGQPVAGQTGIVGIQHGEPGKKKKFSFYDSNFRLRRVLLIGMVLGTQPTVATSERRQCRGAVHAQKSRYTPR